MIIKTSFHRNIDRLESWPEHAAVSIKRRGTRPSGADLFPDVMPVVVVADGELRLLPPKEPLENRPGILRQFQLGVDPYAVARPGKHSVGEELRDLQIDRPLQSVPCLGSTLLVVKARARRPSRVSGKCEQRK